MMIVFILYILLDCHKPRTSSSKFFASLSRCAHNKISQESQTNYRKTKTTCTRLNRIQANLVSYKRNRHPSSISVLRNMPQDMNKVEADADVELQSTQTSSSQTSNGSSSDEENTPDVRGADLPQTSSSQTSNGPAADEENTPDGDKDHTPDADKDHIIELADDIYTMIFLAEDPKPFWYGIVIFGLQFSILTLAIAGQIQWDNEGNYLGLPESLHPSVVASQAAALCISVITVDDVTHSISMLTRVPLDFGFSGKATNGWCSVLTCCACIFKKNGKSVGDSENKMVGDVENKADGNGNNNKDRDGGNQVGGGTKQPYLIHEPEKDETKHVYNETLTIRGRELTRYYLWRLSNALRLVEGYMVLATSFIFVVQSDTIISVLINFAAISFISEMDNIAFTMALRDLSIMSYHGIGDEARRMQKTKLRFRPHNNVNKLWTAAPCVGLYTVVFVMLGVWGTQFHRKFIEDPAPCTTLKISFEDKIFKIPQLAGDNSFIKEWWTTATSESIGFQLDGSFDMTDLEDLHYSYFSGTYEMVTEDSMPTYHEADSGTESGKFYYCEDEKVWAFTVGIFARTDNNIIPESNKDKCKHGWLLKSPKTTETTLEMVPNEGWITRTGRELVKSDVSITCPELMNQCMEDIDCGEGRGSCLRTDAGGRQCTCHAGYTGPFCQYEQPCNDLVHLADPAHGNQTNRLFSIVPNVTLYDRKVFTSIGTKKDRQHHVLLYTGSRWYHAVLTENRYQKVMDSMQNSKFHPYWTNILSTSTKFYSEETDAVVPTGGLRWFRILTDFQNSIPDAQRFDCLSVDCSNKHACGLSGRCRDNVKLAEDGLLRLGLDECDGNPFVTCGGKCECQDGSKGHYCELES